jgi:hypothetical protein
MRGRIPTPSTEVRDIRVTHSIPYPQTCTAKKNIPYCIRENSEMLAENEDNVPFTAKFSWNIETENR